MPANQIMPKFRAHELHSGGSGKIVTNLKQAKAILLSYLRKEGKINTPAPNADSMAERLNDMKKRKTLKTKAIPNNQVT